METPANAIATDIVVVGAGVAGLYSAWRLGQQHPGKRIHVLEMLPRTGGRLDTDHVVVDGVTVKTEEGGMRFTASHLELIALLTELGLLGQAVPFPMGSDHNVFYLRGQRFTFGDAKKDPRIWSKLYRVQPSARGKQPGDILSAVLNAVLIENGIDPTQWNPTSDDWTRFRIEFTYKGIPTYRWGMWALLADFGLTQDCIEMMYQSSGFIAPYDQEINAGCAFQLLADFVNPEFRTIASGFESIPEALATRSQQGGAAIHLQTEVNAVDRLDDGRLLVTARRSAGTIQSFVCPTLILALPQMALKRLMPHVPMMRDDPQFLADLGALTDMPLSKVNLYYAENWWSRATKIENGGSFTDLPLASFYCYGPSGPVPARGPASVTLYSDFVRSNYWSELQGIGQSYHSGMFPENPPNTTPASTYVVAAATRQLSEMLGVKQIPAPVLTTYRRWTDPAMGDGNHQWRIGVNDREVRRRMANPFPGIYTCGEAWSDDQAWVNGALRSADTMLQRLAEAGAPLAAAGGLGG